MDYDSVASKATISILIVREPAQCFFFKKTQNAPGIM